MLAVLRRRGVGDRSKWLISIAIEVSSCSSSSSSSSSALPCLIYLLRLIDELVACINFSDQTTSMSCKSVKLWFNLYYSVYFVVVVLFCFVSVAVNWNYLGTYRLCCNKSLYYISFVLELSIVLQQFIHIWGILPQQLYIDTQNNQQWIAS